MRSVFKRRVGTAAAAAGLLLAGPVGGAFGHRAMATPSESGPADNYVLVGGIAPADAGSVPSADAVFAGLPAAGFAGYSSGTVFYADAYLSGRERMTDVELGFSSASFSSAPAGERRNELNRLVAPPLAGGDGFGRGSAVDLAFNQAAGAVTELLPRFNDEAEAKAPPSARPASAEENDVELKPVIDAQSLQANAAARAVPDGCVVGTDLGFGRASLINAALAHTGGGDHEGLIAAHGSEPARGVSESVSRTRLIPGEGPDPVLFGLMAESRETVGPITVLEGRQRLTIEVAGEWVLRAVSDGGTGTLTFGPVGLHYDRPLLRVIDAQNQVVSEVTLREYLGSGGLEVEVPGLVEIILGEDPRAIGEDQTSVPPASAELVAGAADVLRVQALDELAADFAELRVGHMEAAVAVPPGGLACPGVSMSKTIDRRAVAPGDTFVTTVTVTNPNDCTLDDVTVTETITATPGVEYKARARGAKRREDPPSTILTFHDIGPLRHGESKVLRIEIEVDVLSPPGLFRDVAVAAGTCGRDPSTDDGGEGGGVAEPVPVTGRAELEGPAVTALAAQAPGGPLSSPPGPAFSGPRPAAGTAAARQGSARPSAVGPSTISPAALRRPAPVARPASAGATPSNPGTLARSGAHRAVLTPTGAVLLVAGAALRRGGRRRSSRVHR